MPPVATRNEQWETAVIELNQVHVLGPNANHEDVEVEEEEVEEEEEEDVK